MIQTNLLPEGHRTPSRRRRSLLLPVLGVIALGLAGWRVGLSAWWAFEIHQAQVTLRSEAPAPAWGTIGAISYAELMRSLAVALPADDLWLLGLEDEEGGTIVRGQAREDESVFSYLSELREAPAIRSAHLLRLFKDPQGRSEFLLQVDAGHREAR